MNDIRHCVVITRFALDQPGYLDFAYRIKALAKQYRVTLVSDHALAVPEMQIAGVEHVVLGGVASFFGWLRYLWCAALLIRRQRPDCVVLLHTLTAPVVYGLGKTPHVLYWNEHPTRFKSDSSAGLIKGGLGALKYWLFFVIPARQAGLIMPIGEAHREDLIALGCKPERVRMIYMGVDESFSGIALQRQRSDINAPLELIYTGTIQKERGRDVMLEAVSKARRSGIPVRLTLVGARPDEQEYCVRYARQLGIEREVVLHGRVPGSEIPRFIAGADAGICIWEDRPWWRFNPPTKLFEYMVAGLPTLASDIRTHTEYIHHGRNGLIFKYNSNSLADAIGDLWRRRAELNEMKQNAFESGRKHLWNNIEPVFLAAAAHLLRE